MDTVYQVDKARLEAVARKHHLDLIVLFGSYAKQRAIAGQSDLDIAVRYLEGKYPRGRIPARLYTDLANALQPKTELELAILNRAGPLLLFEVARSGIALYQSTPISFARFKVAASRAYDDNQKFFAARERYMKAKYGG